MNTTDYHIEEYKLLMDDRTGRIQEVRHIEILVITATATVYVWLASQAALPYMIWYVPTLLSAFAIYRVLVLRRSIRILNEYIMQLEAAFNRESQPLVGFETWRSKRGRSGVTISTYVFWSLLLLLTLIAPLALRRSAVNPLLPKIEQATGRDGSTP